MKTLVFGILLAFFLAGCVPAATPAPTATQQVISVHASPATEPWLDEIYQCAKQVPVVVSLSAAESTADLALHFGEPEQLSAPAFQIGTDDLLIVTNRESPIQNLTADEARALFSQGQENVQLWAYASGADVQDVFEREIMQGAGINSLARLAANPQQMSDTLNAEKNAVGLLPRRWKAGTTREVFTLAEIPVLVITPVEPEGPLKELIACLQK